MSTVPWSMPQADVSVTPELMSALLERDHPDLVPLGLGEVMEGWDCVTIRLGPDLAVRVPRRAHAADVIVREHVWLPRLAQEWTFAAPVPVRIGGPSEEIPWAWAVVPWIEGSLAFDAPLSGRGASDLGKALAQVHVPAPEDAPRNPFRSVSLAERAERFDDRVERLVDSGVAIDADLVRSQYRAGAVRRRPPDTWAHLDLHGANVLTDGGRLAGILDWGDMGAGDPATDLGHAWCLVGSSRMRDVLKGYGSAQTRIDEAAMQRVRAEALAFAVTLAALDDATYSEAGRLALADLEVLDRR